MTEDGLFRNGQVPHSSSGMHTRWSDDTSRPALRFVMCDRKVCTVWDCSISNRDRQSNPSCIGYRHQGAAK